MKEILTRENLESMSLEDVLKLLPKKVKFISIWHYLTIKRGDSKHKWNVVYGAYNSSSRQLKEASINMLLNLKEHNNADIEHRMVSMLKKGYITLSSSEEFEDI